MSMNNQYPIYVISKGRWKRRQTSKTLERMNVPYRIVIEPQEYEEYSKVIDPSKILVLPFYNLGQGSIPARNWVWEHSISEGHERHWILDDNIEWIYRYNNNQKVRCTSATPFAIIEEFVNRYENLRIAGMNYAKFCPDTENRPPVRFNTRVYSCLLIDNSIPFRWRGRYNEDTDLCIRVMKEKGVTALFNAFLIDKRTTMNQTGGNTDELYQDDGRLKMAQSLVEQHPDIASVTWKFNRWQHQVDYRPFELNRLFRKTGLFIPEGINNYGMRLIDTKESGNHILENPNELCDDTDEVQDLSDQSKPSICGELG